MPNKQNKFTVIKNIRGKLYKAYAAIWYNIAYIEMHGQQNMKFGIAQQAKQIHRHKNIKVKLYKAYAAIWYNIAYIEMHGNDTKKTYVHSF
jgi:hypothetical protein